MNQRLSFRYPFRKYQRLILAQVNSGQGDHRYHLVAPPGAGKTIVGLELIRQFGEPTVVFTPTTTIQAQWREKVGMFLNEVDDRNELLAEWVSLEPGRLAPINIFTYQLISTPGESQARVQEIAIQEWRQDLLVSGRVADEGQAAERLAAMQGNNPRAYRAELSKRYLRVKRQLLRQEGIEIGPFLHPNARQLIQSLLDYGVRTVVLDECHHLLDYWAIVLKYLISQIQDPLVIGLTATLPSPEDDRAYENYTSLMGEVDYEIPTPAVVKEGDLAPYRDLVYFVEPSRREIQYLTHIQRAFEASIAALTSTPAFRTWVENLVIEKSLNGGQDGSWESFLNQSPLLSLAALRFLRQIDRQLPASLPRPLEADEDITLEDWAVLLERYGLDVLKVSPDPEDHHLLTRLKKILLPFGFSLTERGLRQSRSPGDLVLAFSESKDQAVIEIIMAETNALKDRLRVVVVTDFERLSSGVRQLQNVLDPDAGSALRLFSRLAVRPELDGLRPVLVTGKTLLVDSTLHRPLLDFFNAYFERQGLAASCTFKPSNMPDVLEVVGQGKDWSSRSYVSMVTAAFEQGLTRCLVGTRGIFGEGWDSLALNTLIDLTSVTTSTSVQQLRGRSLRLDPTWPHKVSHNWDVVCVATKFEKGYSDLKRFIQRHERYWGVIPLTRWEQWTEDIKSGLASIPVSGVPASVPALAPGSELRGQIVKGVMHVSPQLAYELTVLGFKRTHYQRFTDQMIASITRRERSYELWGIGDEYSNFSYSTTRLDGGDLKIRTVFSLQETLKAMLRAFRLTFLGGMAIVVWVAAQFGLSIDPTAIDAGPFCLASGLVLTLGTLLVFVLNLRQAYRIARKFLVEQPPDAILLDVGRAVLDGLKQAGLVSRNLQPEYVRVVEQPDLSYDVFLDYASPEDASVFIQAYRQVFAPVRDQRYLILRDDSRLPNLILTGFWRILRAWYRKTAGYPPAYHPVPDVLAIRKDLAEAFSVSWQRYVGGGKLVYTRSENGRRMLLHARTQQRPKVKGLAFEIWR